MKDKSLRVLIVEDSENDTLLIIRELKKGGYNPVSERVETASSMKEAIKDKQWDIILCDYSLPNFNAPSAITLLKEANVDIPLFVVTGAIGEETAAESMRLGAQDYIMKGNLSRLCPAIARELEDAKVRNRQKKAETALLESEANYRQLFDNAPTAIYRIDFRTGKFLKANGVICEYFGCSQEEITSLSPYDLLTEESKILFSERLNKMAAGDKVPEDPEYEFVDKNGKRRWLQLNSKYIYDSEGLLGADVVAHDITEQKEAEKDLRESEERFRRISAITSDIEYSCSTKEDGLFSIDWMIGATERISGYSIDEIKAQRCWRFLVLEEDLALFDKNVVGLAPGSHVLCEIRIRHKNGGIVWIVSNTECFMDTATPEHFMLYGALVDITERKRTEEALRQNEEKYRTILEDIQEGYFEVDFAGNFTFFNDSLRRFLGYSKEELMGMNNRQYTDKEHSKNLFQTFKKVYDTGKPTEGFDWQIIKKDGTKKYVEASVSLQKDSSGKPIGFRGIVRDVTERKRMLEELRESEKQYRTFFNTSRDCVFITSINGRWIDMNDAAIELFGYSNRDELMLISIPDLYIKKEERTKFINTLLERGYTKDYPVDLRRKDGGVINTLITSNLRYDVNGRATELMGTIKDITERKKSEEALKNSEEKYRNIFENSVEGIYQSTREGKFITANAAFARMAGYDSPEELIESIKDMGTQLYVHPEDRKRLMEISETKHFVEGFEVEFYKKDGSKFWVVINARTVKDEQGKILYIEGLIEDITIRKHSEELLHQTLESLKKAVGTTIQVLVSAVESRDPYTAGHQKRVADLARSIATEMVLPHDTIEGIRMAGSIHDIGKLSIPAEILSKPTKLTNIEFSLIKEHSQSGYEMLKDVESPWPLAQIVYQHHERMNGSGYPRNLKGDEILIEARIMAVADVVEAMSSHRPYRPALGIEIALEEITKNKGILYDNAVVDACLKLFLEKGYLLK
jgi:PAS domain S-box-containing protein